MTSSDERRCGVWQAQAELERLHLEELIMVQHTASCLRRLLELSPSVVLTEQGESSAATAH